MTPMFRATTARNSNFAAFVAGCAAVLGALYLVAGVQAAAGTVAHFATTDARTHEVRPDFDPADHAASDGTADAHPDLSADAGFGPSIRLPNLPTFIR